MKKILYLKKIVDVIWYLNLLTIPIVVITIISSFEIFQIFEKPKWIQVHFKTNLTTFSVISSLIQIAIFFLNLFILFFMRKIVNSLLIKIIFEQRMVSYFFKIGYYLIIISILHLIDSFILPIFEEGKIDLSIEITPFIILFGGGIFFMVLSEIIKNGLQLQLENELTI